MAEYYPLLAKAVGSLPNSTPESRRVVYERARKALIGQLRTLHPPIPDDDIERESVTLDQAIERLESELATGVVPAVPPVPPTRSDNLSSAPGDTPPSALPATDNGGAIGPAEKKTIPPLRAKFPLTRPRPGKSDSESNAEEQVRSSVPEPVSLSPSPAFPERLPQDVALSEPSGKTSEDSPRLLEPPVEDLKRLKVPRADPQRPIAPQPPTAKAQNYRLWIIPVAVGVVVGGVAFAAWKLRDNPDTIVRGKPAEQIQVDSGKIAERVGGPDTSTSADSGDAGPAAQSTPSSSQSTPSSGQSSSPSDQQKPGNSAATASPPTQQAAAVPAPGNPELPIAHRAALLVEAPNEPNKVKTFLGTVVWKLNNVPQGPNDAVGLAVEADIDLPDDKMKAVVTFAKNTEASLPASHTINVRFTPEPGSFTGDVKQISVPQMRPEASASGEALAGVTVQIVPNSFLVGLSPGNAETANTDLMRRLQWIDIPMLLDSGKIAKLTFEKSNSGQRDLTEALDAWQKQP